jgi:hypothetical protein
MRLRLKYGFPTQPVCSLFLSPEHHNYPNYYHHRNPRSPYDIDRSSVWYVQKLCHHYCEFALSVHGIRRVGRFNAARAALSQPLARQNLESGRFSVMFRQM